MMLQAMMQLDASRFTGPMQEAQGAMQGSLGSLGKLAGGVAKLGAAYLSFKAIMSGFSKSISLAADTQDAEIGFGVLLGSAEAAKQRVKELTDFAASTPFQMPEVLAASRTLETLTKGALATGEGLRLVGDVAAGTGQPFSEVSTTIGRLYDGLQSGRPVGEAMMRLQELGAISGDTRAKIEALQKSGAAGSDVWAVASGALSRFSGMMEQKSEGWNGLTSTLKDGVDGVFRAFGQPVMEALVPALKGLIVLVGKLEPMARAFGKAIAAALGLLTSGEAWKDLGKIILAGFLNIGAGLIRIFAEPLIFLQAGMDRIRDGLFSGLSKIPGVASAMGLENFQSRSFDEHLAQRRSEGTFLTRAADESRLLARDLLGNDAQAGNGGNTLAAAAQSLGADLAKALPDGLAWKKAENPAMASASDRLAKIGLFVGGGGQAATQTRLQERTARATERLGVLMKELINKEPGAAAWA